MTFGGQTVTFVTVTESGSPGYLGLKTKTRTETEVVGCHFRPFTTAEEPDAETDVSTEVWKCTAPPDDVVLAAKPNGEVIHAGVTFQIQGPVQPKYDGGRVHHVTVMCKRQAG